MATHEQNGGPASRRYEELKQDRYMYLERARESAKLTVPDLFPPEGQNSHTQRLPSPWNSVGARGVNNLSSKITMALFPPGQSFYNFSAPQSILEEASQTEGVPVEDLKPEIDKAFANMERTVLDELEDSSFRTSAFEAVKQLVVGGNTLLFINKKGKLRIYRLDRYVCQRDPMGRPVEIITVDSTTLGRLPENIREIVREKRQSAKGEEEAPTDHEVVDIYTHVRLREDDREEPWYKTYQEVEGEKIPGSDGSYRVDRSPWIPLRFIRVDGEDYGRGYVEQFAGDLRSLNSLTKAIVQGALGSAKQLWWVRPGAMLRPKDMEKESGSVVVGEEGDAGVYRSDKVNDFRTADTVMEKIEQRLSMAFLLANPRDAERVTAEEIRMLASMLEDALGGIYSVLSQEFQRPLIHRYLDVFKRQGKLPEIPIGMLKVKVVTGIEALGRNHELQKLESALRIASTFLGPEVTAEYIKPSDTITKIFTSQGLDTDAYIRSEEEVQQRRQQRIQQQMMEKGTPEIIKQGGSMVQNAQKANLEQGSE